MNGFDLAVRLYGHADPKWGTSKSVGNDNEFPVLVLPAGTIEYSTGLAYVVHVAATAELFVMQIGSYEGDPGGWAIPLAYTPKDDAGRVRQLLGFDEGWENARPECVLVCDERWRPFWKRAFARKVVGVGVEGGATIYPRRLNEREQKAAAPFLDVDVDVDVDHVGER